jgi:hypothetical protein
MKLFNVGAMCQATDDARLSATNDLVQRTLSQHGLVPQSGQTRGMKLPNMPALDHMLARLNKPSKGAGAAQAARPAGAEFKPGTFSCQAGSRSYYTYSPASATNGATGVVMMLHGCTQTPEDFAAGTGMNTLAEQHRFIVVYPAQSRGDNMQSCWNWFSHGDPCRNSQTGLCGPQPRPERHLCGGLVRGRGNGGYPGRNLSRCFLWCRRTFRPCTWFSKRCAVRFCGDGRKSTEQAASRA